jgi:hypothetical protein
MHPGIPPEFVLTPHGLVHQSCVHKIEDDTPRTLPPCQKQPTDIRVLRATGPGGWIESATFTPSVPLGSLSVTFTVPEPPSKTGALIYLFPGAEDARLSTILQPVLQWGCNGRFGGDHWTIACWHCTPQGQTRHSPHFEVSPGDTIVGTVKTIRSMADACDWRVEISDVTQPDKCAMLDVLNVNRLFLFVVAGALEAYSLETGNPLGDHWSEYPASGSTAFTDIALTDLNGNPFRADWNARIPSGLCGLGVEVSDDRSAVTLIY